MKIKVNKVLSGNPTISVTFSKRQLELFTALIGASSSSSLTNTINQSLLGVKTDSNEVNKELSWNYSELRDTLKNDLGPNILKIVEFVYDKDTYGESPKWRNLHVTSENSLYIEGLEDGITFKKFLKSRITGGKIITVG